MFVVTYENYYDETQIAGVFSSLEKAQEWISESTNYFNMNLRSNYTITEKTIDQSFDPDKGLI